MTCALSIKNLDDFEATLVADYHELENQNDSIQLMF